MLAFSGNHMNIQSTQPIKWYWCAVILLLPIALGIGALRNLMQSPELPDCLSESSSNQEAASVFYCATMLASEQDIEKLHQAIRLVNGLPKDNPLRNQKLLDKWSLEILYYSENAAQSGELSKAVDIAHMIPVNVAAHQTALKKIQQWKSIWSQAEAINQAAKEIIGQDDKNSWYLAVSKAKELRRLDNEYWATTKYQELVHYIQDVTEKNEESKRLETEFAKSINIQEVDLMQELQVTQEAEDVAKLKKARILASSGKIDDMRAAIDEANLIISDTQYEQAQKFISTIKNKIEIAEDASYLQEAKKLALKNDEISLQLAITRASLISEESLLYKEANKNVEHWKQKLLQFSSQPLQPQLIENNEAASNNNLNLNELEDKHLNQMNVDLLLENTTDKFSTP
ncbi:MAG: hypothetical protein KME23_28555 [Goleter apudmare HA4340-LM2]|nr:hypothetical protein [Goleter apudmare HA4340-LM2]